MIDLTIQTERVQRLILQTLDSQPRPFPARETLGGAVKDLAETIFASLVGADQELIDAIYPVFLCLLNYELVAEQTTDKFHYWTVRPAVIGFDKLVGIGWIALNTHALEGFYTTLQSHENAFGVLYYNGTPEERITKRNILFSAKDVMKGLLIIAVVEYIIIFQYTLSSIPGWREKLNLTLKELTGFTSEDISTVSKRWSILKNKSEFPQGV